ncbi:Rsp5p-dependent ubiquitination, sorting of cargo proteins at the multivesicular body [Dissophora ornata]|nr:Rsp5p-dependent ubiquitination, sorting of cargo proteins at the multivesicular body [Dissophora ornata]
MNQLEASIQTNLPMPKQQEVYYWEVKIFEKSADTVVSVGVSTKPYPNTRLPGWTRHSVAYFSKDGQKYCNSPFSGYPYGPIYYEGDVVGCGYRPRTGNIFFTRNGKRLEDAYTGLKFNLFPTVGATGSCVLHVNLGQSGFVFVEANVKKWGLAPANGSLVPPPAYGSELGSILLEAGSAMGPAPPTRRPTLQSSQSRARIEAAGVLVQIEEEDGAGESGSDYGKKVTAAKHHISLSNMSAPQAPPHYSSVTPRVGTEGSESDDETTAFIAETISRPVGRGRSGTMNSTASGSGNTFNYESSSTSGEQNSMKMSKVLAKGDDADDTTISHGPTRVQVHLRAPFMDSQVLPLRRQRRESSFLPMRRLKLGK